MRNVFINPVFIVEGQYYFDSVRDAINLIYEFIVKTGIILYVAL